MTKDVVRGVRNIRAEMNVPNNRKAQVYIVAEQDDVCAMFEEIKETFGRMEALMSATRVAVQNNKEGISEDAVSVITPNATVYLPMEELVDLEKEKERLTKEAQRLDKEIARAQGMLNNERFISKAPAAKVQEEKDNLASYTKMKEQGMENLANLQA